MRKYRYPLSARRMIFLGSELIMVAAGGLVW